MSGGLKLKRIILSRVKAGHNAVIERMESRVLMSSTLATGVFQPDYNVLPHVVNTTVSGYVPADIRSAYGFNSVSFGGGSVAANGAGQTIAIVDAFNDPNIVSDLAYFDARFNLPAPPSFRVVNQAGGTALPATDSGWAGEISLDVEWAHAIAPGANILLVEANSASIQPFDLLTAVNYARNVPGVSVVSMSWGGSEFFNQSNLTGLSNQTTLDATFTTPAGHQGVTFFASAGDSGSGAGVQYPSASPNVISVGGTTLNINTNGTYNSESGWAGTNGGVSQFETAPSFQVAAQVGLGTNGFRSCPDVSYIADPNTGVAIWDTVPDSSGNSGWLQIGGTSASAPQWAALVAIADQGRQVAGLGTLDGPTQTLPQLYGLYSAPGTPGYSTYTTYFHDVQSGGNGTYRFRWSGDVGNGITAQAGYDEVTGLGSPHAANVIDALANNTATVVSDNSGNGTLLSSGSGGNAAPTAYPVGVTFLTNPAAVVYGGEAGSLRVQLTDTHNTTFAGPVTITVYVSTDGTISSDDSVVATMGLKSVVIRPTGVKNETIRFHYPANLPTGTYQLLAQVQQTGSAVQPGVAVPPTPVIIQSPTVDLATTFETTIPVPVREGIRTVVTIRIQNLGNVTARGTLNLSLFASSNGLIDVASTLLASLSDRRINIGAGRTIRLRLSFNALANKRGGAYSLIAQETSTIAPADVNSANNTAVVPTRSA